MKYLKPISINGWLKTICGMIKQMYIENKAHYNGIRTNILDNINVEI